MGTNFYIMTKDKEIRDKYFGYDYELTDEPDWGYQQHVAKTSAGWLPLFQSHDSFKSVKQLKKLYDIGKFILYDEYGTEYDWESFNERVLKFNGGTVKNRVLEPIYRDKSSPFYDPNMPDHIPVSHFEYKTDFDYMSDYFTDPDGYEFTTHEFG